MIIEQLRAGQEVTLEVLIGGSSFELKTEVVGTNAETGALVKPYVYNGQVVDFTNGSPQSMTFSLHCIDPHTGGRVVWKNVAVNVIKFRGVDYYAVDAKAFGKIAASSERREDVRVHVKKPGSALMEDGRRFSISVLDISDSGVSFIGNANRVQYSSTFKGFSKLWVKDLMQWDIIIRTKWTYGHIAIVDHILNWRVYVLEQNGSWKNSWNGLGDNAIRVKDYPINWYDLILRNKKIIQNFESELSVVNEKIKEYEGRIRVTREYGESLRR